MERDGHGPGNGRPGTHRGRPVPELLVRGCRVRVMVRSPSPECGDGGPTLILPADR
jgi:hypothetical protein